MMAARLEDYHSTSETTGMNEKLIKRFYIILKVMSRSKVINATKFAQFTFDTTHTVMLCCG